MIIIRQDETWETVANELYQTKLKIKQLAEKEKAMLDVLKKLSDNKPSMSANYKFDSYVRMGNVDYSLIPELQNVELGIYRKPASLCWKLDRVEQVEI